MITRLSDATLQAQSVRRSHKTQARKWMAMRLLKRMGEIKDGTDMRRMGQ